MAGMNETSVNMVSIDVAAKTLGVSTRTVRRRLTSGELAGERHGREWLVRLPDVAPSEIDTLRDTVRTLTDTVDRLSKQLSEVETDRDHTGAMLEAVTADRDYLRQAHAASLTLTQKLLPERAEAASKPPRWQFWKHQGD